MRPFEAARGVLLAEVHDQRRVVRQRVQCAPRWGVALPPSGLRAEQVPVRGDELLEGRPPPGEDLHQHQRDREAAEQIISGLY